MKGKVLSILRSDHVWEAVGYALAFGILFIAHLAKISLDPGLMGEELASAYRNVIYFEHRLLFDGYVTVYSAPVYFWLGSLIVPISVNSARIWKILTFSLLAPMLMRYHRELDPRSRPWERLISVLSVFMMMPLVWYGILGIEFVIDSVTGFAFLYWAYRLDFNLAPKRLAWSLAGLAVLFVWTFYLFGASVPTLLIGQLMLAWKVWQKLRAADRKIPSLYAAYLTLCLALLCWPRLYFGMNQVTGWLPAGGGGLSFKKADLLLNLKLLRHDLFEFPASYLITGYLKDAVFYPATGGLLLISLIALGIWWSRKNPLWKWLMALAWLSPALATITGPTSGFRRVVPMMLLLGLWLGVGLARLLRERPAWKGKVGIWVSRLAWGGLAAACAWVFVQWQVSLSNPFWTNEHAYWLCGIVAAFALATQLLKSALPRQGIAVLTLATVIAIAVWKFDRQWQHSQHVYSAWVARVFRLVPYRNYEIAFELEVGRMRQGPIHLTTDDYSFDTVASMRLFCERRHWDCAPVTYTGNSFRDVRIASKIGVNLPPQ